jgi:hypothetical protein
MNFLIQHTCERDASESGSAAVGAAACRPICRATCDPSRHQPRVCCRACELTSAWWSFDVLASATARETAVCVGTDADMIWCAAHVCEALPEPVRECLDAWSSRRSQPDGAVVALLHCPPGYLLEQSPARTYLYRLARSAGMELFLHTFDCGCPSQRQARQVIAPTIAPRAPDPGRWASVEAYRHWGINE